MKVVLFCGGQHAHPRLFRERTQADGPRRTRSILWHVMQYYHHYGHSDFILCLGYKANIIKQWFLDYRPAIYNDFVLSEHGTKIRMLGTVQEDWRATLIDTGIWRNIGDRLAAVGVRQG